MAEAKLAAATPPSPHSDPGDAIAILIVDDARDVLEANLAACRALGLSRTETVGRSLDELVSDAAEMSLTADVLPGRHLVLLAQEEGDSEVPTGGRIPSARERQILGLLAGGDTDAQIARKLGLSPATVQTHVRNAKAKLGARTRAQAVVIAMRGGLIPAA